MILISRVDCDKKYQEKLELKLLSLKKELNCINLNDKDVNDIKKIILFDEENKLLKYVNKNKEFEKIRKQLEDMIRFDRGFFTHFGLGGYVFLKISDPMCYLNGSIIFEEIIHALIDFDINNTVHDEIEDILIRDFEFSPPIGSGLFKNSKAVVVHYFIYKTMINMKSFEICEELKINMKKRLISIIKTIKNKNCNEITIGYYFPDFIFVNLLSFDMKTLNGNFIIKKYKREFNLLLDIFENYNYLEIPTKGTNLMKNIFLIQYDICKKEIKKNPFEILSKYI